jgi:hypothetical protein
MKGKIIKTDKEWMVEIQSDLHGYGIGWGDPMIYPVFITDENIWEGKEVEVEPIQYDSNFLPVIVKIKTNNMKPKTFEELFAGSGIEPTKDENGGVHYNFNATLKNEPMKTETAVTKLCQSLKEDESYYISWKSNIAMAFYDEFYKTYPDNELAQIHTIANTAADNFLKLLINQNK